MQTSDRSRLVISTVGASLLYQGVDQDLRVLLNRMANLPSLSPEEQAMLAPQIERAQAILHHTDVAKIRRASAELNGIYALYEGQITHGARDIHVLITTDTAFGRQCAELVETHLHAIGIGSVEVKVISKLTASDSIAFQEGCKELISWCTSYIPAFRDQGHPVIFNLVAAFKALQGYLNTIGMFYADQIMYLFEGPSAVPIFIPRLPIRVDIEGLRTFSVPLALMAEGDALLSLENLRDLPETLYNQDGSDGCISEWGKLIWNQMRADVLSQNLLVLPRLDYDANFQQDYARIKVASDRIRLQSKLALASAKLVESNGDTSVLKGGTSGGILYDNFVGKSDHGVPIGHFRISDGLRVSCLTRDGRLVMRHVGPHDYVNSNP
jgi:putative CRISPR-associated protein (TIGR02619 family)